MAGNDSEGFILNHSTPKFPVVYEDTGNIDLYIRYGQRYYGQHFFCMSTGAKELNEYAVGLQVDNVYVMKDYNESYVSNP